jgi:hypothetical protein
MRTTVVATIVALLATAACGQTINSFETDEQVAAFAPSQATAERVAEHATEGQHSLRVVFHGSETDTWPGLVFVPPGADLTPYAILAFDVYNAEDAAIALSCRIDDAAGKNYFTGWNLPPNRTTTIELWTASLRYDLDLKRVTSIYPYLRMPRRDATLYFDNVRFEALTSRFKPAVYEEKGPALEPTAQDAARGYVAFSRPWMASVFPQSRPGPGERLGRVQVFGCPGQTVPATVSVWALKSLGQTRVDTSDVVQGARRIPAASTAVYPVRCLDKRVVYSSDYYIKDMPVLLEERESVAVPEGRSQTFWLDVSIPTDAAPGLYEGSVTVSPTLGESQSLPLEVRVLPYSLQEPGHMLWGEYYSRPRFANSPAERNAAIARDLADQRAHGMTSVGLCFGFEAGEFAVDGANTTLSLRDDGAYTAFMQAYKYLGFPAPVMQLADDGQTAAAAFALGSAEWRAAYKSFWIAVQKLHRERGWPEVIVQPVDEPGWQGPAERERNLICLQALKEITGLRTEQDGPGDGYFIGEAGPFADVWNFNGALADPDVVARAQKQGRTILTYNNDVESYRPEVDRYVCGFYQLRAGAQGAFNWEYMGFGGDPYNDQDSVNDSWLHRYPALPEQGEVGGYSTGWQGTRAGVDDYRYAYTLEQVVVRGLKSDRKGAREAAQRAQVALRGILGTVDYSPATRERAVWTSTETDADGSRRISGQLRFPNGWEYETYDQARWQLAVATVDVLAALGDVPLQRPRPIAATGTQSALLRDLQWTVSQAGQAPGAVVAAAKQVSIPRLSAAPNCDGDLRDPVWAQAADLGPFTSMDGNGPPSQQTRVRVGVDQTHLYFAVECQEESIAQITAGITEDGGPVWQDDCIELFFDPGLSRTSYRQIGINSLGKVSWNSPADPGWRPQILRGAAVDAAGKRWNVEIGVPLSGLTLTANTFGLNVCRERRPLESLELSCWSPTGGSFGTPERFGVATTGDSYLSGYRLGRGCVGSNELELTLCNASGRERNLLALLNWRQQGSTALYRQKGPFPLAPGQTRKVAIAYEIVTDRAPVALEIAVQDTDSGDVLGQQQVTQQVEPVVTVALRPRLSYLSQTEVALEVRAGLDRAGRDRAVLIVQVFGGEGGQPLRRLDISGLEGDQLCALLNVAGLPAGTHRVEAVLKSGPGSAARRLGTATTQLIRLAGPFD